LILWFFGAMWYSPVLFAKPWMAMVNFPKENKNQAMMMGMVSSFVCDVILSFVLAHIIQWSNSYSFKHGALIGFIVWAGFFVAPNLPQGIYEGRPFKLFSINSGYWLIGLIIVGGMLAKWQ
jgi:hypothetical protein